MRRAAWVLAAAAGVVAGGAAANSGQGRHLLLAPAATLTHITPR